MSKKDEALELALEALEETRNALAWFYDSYPQDVTKKGNELLPHVETVLTALREALAEQPAQQQEPINKYCCHLCFNNTGQLFLDRMILCPECGNKRCPKATHHSLACTKSNDLGQKGSIYDQPLQQEPVAWKNAAIRLGEELSSVGPDGYYDMTAEQWLDWAMDQRPQGKNFLSAQQNIRNATLDEIATKIEAMPFGDTAASFAVWIREQKT